eukprot:14648421-Alexandrium_andersonii.AAC.1
MRPGLKIDYSFAVRPARRNLHQAFAQAARRWPKIGDSFGVRPARAEWPQASANLEALKGGKGYGGRQNCRRI